MITALTILGYIVTGTFGAIVMFTASYNYLEDLNQIVLASSVAGFSTSLALLGTNVTFKLVLKRLGIELDISVRRVNPKEKPTVIKK